MQIKEKLGSAVGRIKRVPAKVKNTLGKAVELEKAIIKDIETRYELKPYQMLVLSWAKGTVFGAAVVLVILL